MHHPKPGAAVESGVRCPDFSVIQINEKKLLYLQSTMFTKYPPAAELCKDRDKLRSALLESLIRILSTGLGVRSGARVPSP